MARHFIYSSLVAGILCGCQTTACNAPCDDCVPPPSFSGGYFWPRADNYVTQNTAAECARKDLKNLQKSCVKPSKDFQYGFTQAYVDIAMGRPALVPPVPPPPYWSAYYRSCAGAEAVADWFQGYRTALDVGAAGGVARFNRIATTWDSTANCPPEGGVMAPFGTGQPPVPQTIPRRRDPYTGSPYAASTPSAGGSDSDSAFPPAPSVLDRLASLRSGVPVQ